MAAVPKEVEQKIARAPSKAKETKAKAPKPKLVKVDAPAFRDHDTGKVIKGLPSPMRCPFCKHADCSIAVVGLNADDPCYIVECGHCGAESPWGKSQLEAANLWNAAFGGVDLAHQYRLDNLSIRARSVLLRGLKVVLDNSKSDEDFKEAEFLSGLLADFSPPAPKKKQFTDHHDGASIDGLPEPEPCQFCGFHDWTGIVTVEAETTPEGIEIDASYYVQCDGCLAEGPPQASKLEAAQHWNKAARKVDYSIIEGLDALNLTLEHLSDLIVLTTDRIRENGVDIDQPLASCLEAALDGKLEPARERLEMVMRQLSPPKQALTG